MRARGSLAGMIGAYAAGAWIAGCTGDTERDPVNTEHIQQATLTGGFATVIPEFECVTSASGRSAAVFGYTNTGSSTIEIPIGTRNHFSTATNLGQPDAFLPGSHSFALRASRTASCQSGHLPDRPAQRAAAIEAIALARSRVVSVGARLQ